MERFLTPMTSGSARVRNASDVSQQTNSDTDMSDIHNQTADLTRDLELSQEAGGLTSPLSRSECSMSLDSVGSVESSVTEEREASLSEENMRQHQHIAPFYKVKDNKAKCTKCSSSLKMQPGTNANIRRHYEKMHPTLYNELKAALESGSKRGRHKSFQDLAVCRRQTSIQDAMKEKFNNRKCLDLYYR